MLTEKNEFRQKWNGICNLYKFAYVHLQPDFFFLYIYKKISFS